MRLRAGLRATIDATPRGPTAIAAGCVEQDSGTNVQPVALALSLLVLAASQVGLQPSFRSSKGPVPEATAARMRQHSWREGCPTAIADLSYLRVAHLGFDGAVHQGELVVHKDLADEVVAIFRALFDQRFPIEKMKLVDDYQGSDDASIADNNTSAFNCRFVPGKPGVFSKHSQGRAIDINPRINPMVLGQAVMPPAGAEFLDRQAKVPGILREGGPAVVEFARRGWTWGGTWKSLKDYQHFEK